MENRRKRSTLRTRRRSPIWNLLTTLMLLGTCGLVFFFYTIFQNPASPLNPFAPAATPTSYVTETPTSTIIQLPATWTFTPTIKPSATRTKAPTWTLLPEMITPTITYTPTISPVPGTQTTTPTPQLVTTVITFANVNTIHPETGCNWLGVGGKVMDPTNKPLVLQILELGGMLDGKPVTALLLSGGAPAYGTSGFEFVLSDHPIASTKTLWIQLFDNNYQKLTERIFFDTSANCTQNLVLITFTKTR